LLEEKKYFCTFIVQNGGVHERNKFFTLLNQVKAVHSCGPYMNNTGVCAPKGDAYFPFLQKFKFMICFENTNKTNYVTEKIMNAYCGGCIPIYWGTPQVLEWFNPEAFLYLEDTSEQGMQALIAKIMEIDTDPVKYEHMRCQPLIKGTIPACLLKETWKAQSDAYLRKHRPDVF
jgi:hypothetical protein